MAISPYPSPADAGVIFVVLANTAISISIVKEIFRSILQVMGIHFASWEEFSTEPSDSAICYRNPSESYVEEFRFKTPSKRYDTVFISDCFENECPICLAEFEPNSEINYLSCGHIFHTSCVEKWLKYWNTTCPLCRDQMIPQEDEDNYCPM
ncbi:hypothetical protein ACJIZ3_010990 [Penstemon smallii]|uniref:RING-type domain-containing protein n=1 Tax=Penstemon smallii TaxID=265156 RepID=A0ABD3UM37_9LAMI